MKLKIIFTRFCHSKVVHSAPYWWDIKVAAQDGIQQERSIVFFPLRKPNSVGAVVGSRFAEENSAWAQTVELDSPRPQLFPCSFR